MRYGVLGAIEVQSATGRIDLGGSQQRRLVAVFLAAPGQICSTDRLTDALWPDGLAPSGATRSVLTYVSRLRARLDDGSVVKRDGGYLLDLDGCSVDAVEFEQMLGRARSSDPDGAVSLYDAALALWRGRAFGEFADQWWAVAQASRLEELKVAAREERLEALIALGRSATAIADVEALAIEFPMREAPVRLMMLALDGTGRRVEALRAFQRFRQRLIDETGVPPSADLCEFEQSLALDGQRTGAVEGRPLRGYLLHEIIGRGSHGTVYAARQPGTDRDVAVKVIRSEFANAGEYVRRFEMEAQLVARLEHPHIVPLYDYWRDAGGAYLVFRLLTGGNAEDALVTGGRWSTERVGRLVDEVGGALIAAHAAGVFHRDIRPANILLDDRGNTFINDFGIAIQRQAQGEAADSDERADVRDFASTIWELLAGSTPSMSEWRSSLPSLIDRLPDLSPGIDAVLMRASAPEGVGFDSMAEFVLAWRSAVGRSDDFALVRTSSDRRFAARQLTARAHAGVNPYRGLRPFAEADAGDFFGRSAAAADLFTFTESSRFVAIVGPSGSGKTSLVHAGLVPFLRDTGSCLVTSMSPGEHPMTSLGSALSLVSSNDIDSDNPEAWAHRIAGDSPGGLIVIVDQFEECWTLTERAERDAFVSLLATLATSDCGHRIAVVVSIRADMFDRPLQHPMIGQLVSTNTFPLPPLSGADLEDAILLPALRADVAFEDGVEASIITESVANPASLPLLQFALFELFERRVDGIITSRAYNEIGGIAGAIAQRAETLYSRLGPDDQEHARTLFTRLVNPGQGNPDSRRRALVRDLSPGARTIAADFITARLLVSDRDPATREPTIDVAHEAILTQWDRLAAWIDDDRRWLAQLHHLTSAARAWERADRADEEFYRGSRLEAAIEQLPSRRGQLTDSEVRFIEAGEAARNSGIARERRTSRRLRRLLVGVGVLLVLALCFGFLAASQRRTADRRTREARIGALIGHIESIRATQRDTAALLAIEAFRLKDDPATRSALLSTFTSSPGFLDVHRVGDGETGFYGAVLADGEHAFVVGADKQVRPYDLDTGSVGDPFPIAMPPEDVSMTQLVVDRDSRVLAQVEGGPDSGGNLSTTIALFDPRTGRALSQPIHLPFPAGTVMYVDDSNEVVASGGRDGTVVALDAASGHELASLPGLAAPDDSGDQWRTAGLALLGAHHLAVGSVGDTLRIVDPTSLALIDEPIRVPSDTTTRLFSIDGGRTLLGTGLSGVARIDVASHRTIWTVGVGQIAVGACTNVTVVEARSRFYCGDGYGRLEERSLDDGSLIRQLDAQNGSAGSIWPANNATELVGFNDESIVTRWRLDGSGAISRRIDPGLAASQYSPNGQSFIVYKPAGLFLNQEGVTNAVVVDSATGAVTDELGGMISPFWADDNTIEGATIAADGRTQLAHYDLATHRLINDDFIFDIAPDRVMYNSGGQRAWVSVPKPNDNWEIWAFDPRSSSRVEPTVTVPALFWIAGAPDGQRFAAADRTGNVTVFDGTTGAPIAHLVHPAIRGVFFVTNNIIAIGSSGGRLTLFDAGTLTALRELSGSRGFIRNVETSNNGSVMVLQGGDRRVQLIDVQTGAPLGGPITIPDNETNTATLQPTGLQLAIGGGTADGIAIWDLDPAHWAPAACRVAGRNLTRDEWATYLGPLEPYRQTCA